MTEAVACEEDGKGLRSKHDNEMKGQEAMCKGMIKDSDPTSRWNERISRIFK
jgi:hypothetical protein